VEAIRKYGAEASVTEMNFDDAVMHAGRKARENGWILLQDTSWEGYENVPRHVMQGYSILVTESIGPGLETDPTHVFVQAGVGSFAAAVVASVTSLAEGALPAFIVVEPEGAPCLFESIRQGKRIRIKGDLATIMAGLSCGEPSLMGWETLKSSAGAFLMCADQVARRGMIRKTAVEVPLMVKGLLAVGLVFWGCDRSTPAVDSEQPVIRTVVMSGLSDP
jgi:diaminopropionate ammonia-lyase